MTPETRLRLKLLTLGYSPIPARGKRVFLEDWPTEKITKDLIHTWETGKHRRDFNTGVRTGDLVGVDIDCLDPVVSKELKALAFSILGPTQFVRVGMAPKTLLVYRTATPIRKMETGRATTGGPNVEILGVGQQFICSGIHPDTKKLYSWNGMSIADSLLKDIPEVLPDVLEYFVQQAAAVLGVEAHVSGPVDNMSGGKRMNNVEIEEFKSALEALPNDLPHDKWIRIGMVIKHELGEAGLEDWLAFSAKNPTNDEGYTTKKWSGMKPRGEVKKETIFKLARLSGWEPDKETGLVAVRIRSGKLEHMVSKTEKALIDGGAPIYKQGNRLIRPVWNDIKTSSGPSQVMRIADVKAATFMEMFPQYVKYERYDARTKDWEISNCPKPVVEAFMARDDWNLRYLLGVVTAPTLRPNGTVLEESGYDEASGLIYEPKDTIFPKVPQRPTRAQAVAAYNMLLKPISKFPFVTRRDLAVALSCIFTAVVRRALPVAPLHAFSAPAAGTGKSVLVDVAATIATGDLVAVMSTGQDRHEFEKRLTAQALAGELVISIDNIREPLGGDFLCQMVSQKKVTVRPLGKSEAYKIPNTSLLTATGNNLTIEGDLTRRSVICNIDSHHERPELRRFTFDPVKYCEKNRAELVVAVLTIIRAYMVSGKRMKATPIGGFEKWSRFVRKPIMWIMGSDPVASMESIRRDDPELDALRGLVLAWHAALGSDKITIRKLIEVANDVNEDGTEKHPDLSASLLEIAGYHGQIDPKRCGKWLTARKGRAIRGIKNSDILAITAWGSGSNSKTWKVTKTKKIVMEQ